ncbi:serine protease inhibitor 42Dd-like [Portunus trituberculatus]|uniref:serine protease inhibitor 42Dd-like n=1 Tax=Portunus trituberculatus TaxID=210409 RepID=UPI001E1CF983|nr:serine protease inhibitor 42Dd-like [Portunus trituberculatus]
MQLLRELGTLRNTLISPYSLWGAVLLVVLGAEGKTEREILEVLGTEGKEGLLTTWREVEKSLQTDAGDHSQVSLNLANRIYVNHGYEIKKCREELAAILFDVPLDQPLEAATIINTYINTTTNAKIPNIVAPSHLLGAQMVLVNAVYMKAQWEHRFTHSLTFNGSFFPSPEADPVEVTMMKAVDRNLMLGTSETLQAQIIQLPYTGNLLKMTLILPTVKGEAGFNATLNALNSTSFWDALNALTLETVDLDMPKFEIQAKFGDDLKLALERLGMREAFTNAANLSTFGPDLFVKHLLHRTFLSVDEEGSEAAAVTSAVITTKISSFIKVNRPFLFAIHSQEVVLFLGAYKRP